MSRHAHLTKRNIRDVLLLLGGLAGMAYEAVSGLERPTLIVGYLAMMGLTAFLRSDEAQAGNVGRPPSPPPTQDREEASR